MNHFSYRTIRVREPPMDPYAYDLVQTQSFFIQHMFGKLFGSTGTTYLATHRNLLVIRRRDLSEDTSDAYDYDPTNRVTVSYDIFSTTRSTINSLVHIYDDWLVHLAPR